MSDSQIFLPSLREPVDNVDVVEVPVALYMQAT